jgi:hypothetical protein
MDTTTTTRCLLCRGKGYRIGLGEDGDVQYDEDCPRCGGTKQEPTTEETPKEAA